MNQKSLALLLASLLFILSGRTSQAAGLAVTVTADVNKPGAIIPPDFSGLSFESSQELPQADGSHFFSVQNRPLISLLRTLGVKNVRVGGNTADRATVKIPDNADIDSLFGFAKAVGAKVIYTVRLKQGDPQDAARIAKYVTDHYLSDLSCIAIGNEPNAYSHTYTYQAYSADWKKLMTAIVAAVPNAMFCGPSTTPGKAEWVRDFVGEYGPSGHIAFATHHSYPGGAGNKVTDPAAGRAKMLSPDMVKFYENFSKGFVPAVVAQKLKFRLEETNNFFNGGAKDVSDTYASALWGLDYLYWWAGHDAEGINFHTVGMASYTAFTVQPGGFAARPLAYGIKAFDLGAHGRLVPLRIGNAANVDMTAYAALGDDRTLYVTLINKEQTAGRDAQVTVAAGSGFTAAQTIFLGIPGGDVSAKTGMTLGGAPINGDGTWRGSWSANTSLMDGKFVVTVPAASAAVVKLLPN